MNTFTLKDGTEAVLREAIPADAQSIIDFYNIVGGESDFLSFGKNEFIRSPDEYANYIETVAAEDNSIMLLAVINGAIASIATINSSQRARSLHNGTLGIVISEQYTGYGLGKKMMMELIQWAKQNSITKKISLVTREDNLRAIDLYEKLGFEEEGRLKNDTYMNGRYYSAVLMGLQL